MCWKLFHVFIKIPIRKPTKTKKKKSYKYIFFKMQKKNKTLKMKKKRNKTIQKKRERKFQYLVLFNSILSLSIRTGQTQRP